MEIAEIKKQYSIIDYLRDKGIDAHYRKAIRCPHPNHEDRKPSCAVYDNPEYDYFKCYSCDFHGDILDLVGVLENLPKVSDQIKFLENEYGTRK